MLPLTVSAPSNITLFALISKARPDASVGAANKAFCVFLSVKVSAVITLALGFAGAVVSPAARLPTMPAAFMVRSS